jgi:hypothetical protein
VSQPLYLRIAGITMALRCGDPRIRIGVGDPLGRFLVAAASADLEIEVEMLEGEQAARGELIFDSGAVWKLYEEAGGFRIDCHSVNLGTTPYKTAIFDAALTHGRIAIRADLFEGEVNPLDYPLDEVLLAKLLARGRGVELHACGLIDREGQGHLFVGQSGAGKSTTSQLWGEDAALIVSDDRVVVREQGGRMHIHGTPWHGEAALSSPQSAPLVGIYLLTQASANELIELDRAAAVARLFACSFPPFYDPDALAFTLSFLERIVEAVPVRELRFRRDRGAVDLVQGASRALVEAGR